MVPAATRPAQAASLATQPTMSANDIINERGYWQGLTDTPERPVPPAEIPVARTAAVAEAPITGSVSGAAPWPMPDRAGRDAMAYAPANTVVETRPGQAAKARVVAKLPAAQQRDAGTNGTTKQATRSALPGVKVGERFNNPWMRAMIVSPSALDFMSTSLYGAPGHRLAAAAPGEARRHRDDDVLRRSVSRHVVRAVPRQCGGVRRDRDVPAAHRGAALIQPQRSSNVGTGPGLARSIFVSGHLED